MGGYMGLAPMLLPASGLAVEHHLWRLSQARAWLQD